MSGWVVVRHGSDGPILVRGAESVLGEDGTEIPVTRPVVALCACGKSARRPFCDATHKAIPKS